MTETPLLQLTDLEVAFQSSTGTVAAVRKANLTIYPGQSVAIVGESGSGKSTLAAAIIGLLPGTGRVVGGSIEFNGRDITHLTKQQLVAMRGSEIGMIPQDPMSNLNPVWRIGTQVEEALVANGTAPAQAKKRAVEVLGEAGLPDAASRARQFPHEFSGGMRQRALIAIGLAADPKLLIADEPTSALDVTVQRRILDHLETLTDSRGTAVLFITHDLGLAAERASHLVVMHRGRVVESGPSLEILTDPQHPYTQRLVDAAPSLSSARIRAVQKGIDPIALTEAIDVHGEKNAVIEVNNLVKEFPIRGAKNRVFRAVDDVSFKLRRGSTLAVVGESGSGKSTVANMVLKLLEPTSGSILFDGQDITKMSRTATLAMRRRMQVVFQNPYGSLDPTYSVFRVIDEPLRTHRVGGGRAAREKLVGELLDMVALPKSAMRRYPHELSGGQRQRVAIARALALRPEVIVLDEAVSALDVLVQDQILRLLNELQQELSLSYLFITHDLAVVRENADDIVVMQQGRVVEQGSADDIFGSPTTDYTRELIEAVPGGTLPIGRFARFGADSGESSC
ncbi:ABC transporter ATP-binding protein [uncultured Gulosibacter sp.]|uniref:ABC transporter ATP-binding protein n=1 Tax=uncultured Gulosibacter sp. TaxID=1339167 RepID=UPI002889A25E|nr:ABC transporter ATP-binding protein [uncultured Gulosibacter sp.]